MTDINHSKIQQDLSQWKKVVDQIPGFANKHKDLVDLLSDTKYLMEAIADAKRNLLIALGQAAESYGLETIEAELKGDRTAESAETSSDSIDAIYIDELLQDKTLHNKSKDQLNSIKNLLLEHPNSKLNKSRLSVKNGVVMIDGFGLPTEVTRQEYADMSKDNSDKLYPDATIAWLNFTADLTGKTFDRGTLNNKNLTDRSLSYKAILAILQTNNNNAILKSLSMIMGKLYEYQYIPMGIDNNEYVIYAGLRPDNVRFFCVSNRYDSFSCLVPSHIGG